MGVQTHESKVKFNRRLFGVEGKRGDVDVLTVVWLTSRAS